MVKKQFVFLFLAILSISFVYAASTEITIKTLPDHQVYLSILDPSDSNYIFKTMKNMSDQYGDTKFIYTSDEVARFDLMVVIKKGDLRIYSEQFKKKYSAGVPIYLETAPEGSELIETPGANESVSSENETLENETEVLISGNETEKSVSGSAVAEKIKGVFTNKIFYYALGVVVLGVLVFVLQRRRAKGGRGFTVRKLSEVHSEKKEGEKKNSRVAAAEKKLRAAQQELNKLKNAEKIEEMERKLDEQKEELERLKKEINYNF